MILYKVLKRTRPEFELAPNEEFVSFQLESWFDSMHTGQKQYVYHILVREVVEVPSEESPSEALEGSLPNEGAEP